MFSRTPRVLVWLLAWTLFAVAGAAPETAAPLVVGALILTALERPSIARAPYRLLDFCLLACLVAVTLQLVPLPAAVRLAVSPHASGIDRALRLDAPADPSSGPPAPLSIDPRSTVGALLLGLSFVLLFWCARSAFARGGARDVLRGTAWCGLILAAVAILQHATAPRLLYWLWRPPDAGALPFTPFVNRNDLATWLILAIPLTLGYGLARIRSRTHRQRGPIDPAFVFDSTTVWLAGSVCLMTAAVLVSMSRSGLTGLAVGLGSLVWVSRGRMVRRGRAWLAAGLALAVVVATAYANLGALATRVGETLTLGIGGRRAIWHDTVPMIRDFWQAGVGAGAYGRGMLVYQQASRLVYFNHAHNEYLQIAAEGGLLVGAPALVALAAAAWQIVKRLQADHSPVFWMRAGATSGLLAVVAQSLWETGLRIPADAVLFALAAAIALHDDGGGRRG